MRSCLPQEEVFQIVGCAIEGLNPWSWNSWEAIRKMHWSWSLAAKNSIPATARIRRCLQRPESWSVRPWPSRFRFCCGGASGEDKLGGTSLARRSRRRWGPVSPLAEKGATYRPTSDCSRPSQRFPGRGHSPEWTREFAVNGPCLSIRFSSRVL